jgi:hypothetical protein
LKVPYIFLVVALGIRGLLVFSASLMLLSLHPSIRLVTYR